MLSSERGREGSSCLWNYDKSLATHLPGEDVGSKSHHLCLSATGSPVQQPHQRESVAALCTVTQKHVVHGQPGCTENSQMGTAPG